MKKMIFNAFTYINRHKRKLSKNIIIVRTGHIRINPDGCDSLAGGLIQGLLTIGCLRAFP